MTSEPAAEAWRRLGTPDAPILRDFLISREEYAAGFSARLLRSGELRIPGVLGGGVFGYVSSTGLRSAVLWTRSGTVFPVFGTEHGPSEEETLARFFKGGSVVSFLGAAADVEALEHVLRRIPRVATPYRYLYLEPSGRPSHRSLPHPSATVRAADPTDAEALFPLHSAYEREEVVTPIHRFDARASRAALDGILASEIMAVAELDGRAVAAARTNARGFRTWQIGGVYVIPELRGRGWGRFVMEYLVGEIFRVGKAAGLFVKEGNTTARNLYLSMGFRDVGPFRVDYL